MSTNAAVNMGEREHLSQLLVVWTGEVTMEISVEAPQKGKSK